jgi:hypothetical protein
MKKAAKKRSGIPLIAEMPGVSIACVDRGLQRRPDISHVPICISDRRMW